MWKKIGNLEGKQATFQTGLSDSYRKFWWVLKGVVLGVKDMLLISGKFVYAPEEWLYFELNE